MINYRPQLSSQRGVAFTPHTSDLAIYPHLHQKLSLRESSAREFRNAFNQTLTARSQILLKQKLHNSNVRPNSYRQEKTRMEMNKNLVRASNEVDRAMMNQKSRKSSPFRIIKSLSVHTLKRKGQVEEERKEKLRRHQYNPFGSPGVQSVYLIE